jgi:HEAT repeat protein
MDCPPELKEYWHRMRSDPRSIDELVSTALSESDDDIAWDAVCALHFRGTEGVLARAETLCRSDSVRERRLGADILGQLGIPDRTFPKQCLSILLRMLSDEMDADVLQAILVALGHLKESDAIEPASRYRRHPDPGVRHGVVLALTGYDDPRAVNWLIELSCDEDTHVRDWATFAVAQMIDLDTPAIREALAARLEDADYDTRCEAIVGLAKRGDRRVIPVISEELASNRVGSLVVEAAAMIPDPQFHPRLIALRVWWNVSQTTLDEAIAACSPSSCNDQSATTRGTPRAR